MRTRKEIEKQFKNVINEYLYDYEREELILEVCLDIRDILMKKEKEKVKDG